MRNKTGGIVLKDYLLDVMQRHEQGLYLCELPTGNGKTYDSAHAMKEYADSIVDDTKIIYLTTLNKNLPEDALRAAYGNDDLYNRNVLRLRSNFDEVVEKILDIQVPEEMQTDVYLKLCKDVSLYRNAIEKKYADKEYIKELTDRITDGDRQLRYEITKRLKKRFSTKARRKNAVRTDAKYKWIGKLYPAVFTDDYRIILMSVSKFMKRNSILIDSSYEFLNSDLIENAIIIIDEFDATKDTIQSELIEKSLAMQEDYIQLFRQIYRTLNPNDFSSDMRLAMERVENSENRNTFTSLMAEAREIDIVEREDAQQFDISNLEKKGISELEYGEMLQKKGVVIVDENDSEISKDIVAKLQEELEKYYHVKAAVGNLSGDAYNIRIIHDGEYYAENEMHDPHSDNLKGYIVQHITEEAEHFTNTKGSSPDIKKIVQELIIKGDVRERMISIFDWKRLDSGKDWTFVLRKKIKTKFGENVEHMNFGNKKAFNYYNYYRLKIDGNGKMEFDAFCDSNQSETEEWNKICYAYDFVEDKHHGVQNHVEGLMYSNIDNIHAILLTREKTLPNISALMDTLIETDAKERVSKEILLKAINDFETEYIAAGEIISEWKNKLSVETEMITKKSIKKILNMKSGTASKFNRFLHQKYGIWIDGELRKGEFEYLYQIGNLLNIKYDYNENDYLDGRAFVYYVGAKGNNKKTKYPNACCMRKVISLGETLEYEEALPLMTVEFVRNSQFTVLPFPFKYLREYIEQC